MGRKKAKSEKVGGRHRKIIPIPEDQRELLDGAWQRRFAPLRRDNIEGGRKLKMEKE